ncbi:WYL domain-containing protein [Segatella copri]|uniref:helix-turn-helix transcriptional regulator n=1 Tax=Segatella copri TaxID=165179 RepID=UPI002FF1FF3C
MPANKNALIRYKTIDNCLRNKYRRWTIDNLVDACSDALYDMEGISKGVSLRTVQADLQIMRSDKLGYNAPIEVYDGKYYRYADPNYSIFDMPLSENDYEIMKEAVEMLKQLEDFDHFSEMADVVGRLQDKLSISKSNRKPIIHFDSMPNLKGLELLNPLYNYIANKQTLRIMYQSFNAKEANEYILYPYLLKEYRNRWFLFGSVKKDLVLYNLALDRMVSIEPIEEPFRENPKFNSEKFFDDVIGVSKNIQTNPLHHSQQLIRENKDGSCIFQISVVINFELYSVLMSYGPGVRVISPRCAVSYMKDKTKEMADIYEESFHFEEGDN